MGLQKTIGGDRLGAGQKRTEELPEYGRSTHNQSGHFRSTAAAGILYPCFKKYLDIGETIDIDIDQDIRTLPTKGPLFGSYKTQIDLFAVDLRLYQGILHNNPVNIGTEMDKVYLPKLVMGYDLTAPRVKGSDDYTWQINESSLEKYLGLSGIGLPTNKKNESITRNFQCIPELAYFDIFKNYYANKQEENAYVITPEERTIENQEISIKSLLGMVGKDTSTLNWTSVQVQQIANNDIVWSYANFPSTDFSYPFVQIVLTTDIDYFEYEKLTSTEEQQEYFDNIMSKLEWSWLVNSWTNPNNVLVSIQNGDMEGMFFQNIYQDLIGNTNGKLQILLRIPMQMFIDEDSVQIHFRSKTKEEITADIKLSPFALENIDEMRRILLSCNEIGQQFEMGYADYLDEGNYVWHEQSGKNQDGLPYSAIFNKTSNGITYSSFTQSGLLVKTYQNDLFNNWVQTDWIEGENGIAKVSAIHVTDDSFEIDALLLGKAIYNMLIAVAISGGTYQDYLEAKSGVKATRMHETPVYIGGLTGEIMFQEVVSNATAGTGENFEPLGTLGGKGKTAFTKNGTNIHFRAEEPCYIIGIVSITPRINFNQGNDWDRTEIDSMADWHAPAFDRIGFQDLITEQIGWFDTKIDDEGNITRYSAGKVPAWSNYTTEVDRTYGEFAKAEGKSFMVLNRNYEITENGRIKDVTTYIDPAKYNYPFAATDLASNNFWVDIYFKCETRRIMSAHQIPHA